ATAAVLLRAARVGRGEQQAATERLEALEAAGRLVQLPGERWAPPAAAGLGAGRLAVNPNGVGFCQPDDPALDDLHVPARRMAAAGSCGSGAACGRGAV